MAVGISSFSFSRSQLGKVINYILTQEENHRNKNCTDEYTQMLSEFKVGYDDIYLFDFYD